MKTTYIELDEVDSTNLYLSRLLQKGSDVLEGTVAYTYRQTEGRGQRGNSWESEPFKNISCSLVLKPTHIPIQQQFIISQIVALATVEMLDEYASGFEIKWPNDIYWQEKKIGGTLIENSVTGKLISHSIIGIGLNINQQQFYSNAPNPVSLLQITGCESNLKQILEGLIHRILTYYLSTDSFDAIADRYKKRLFRREGFYLYQDRKGIFEARISNIDPCGPLILERKTGELSHYAFKEVSFIL